MSLCLCGSVQLSVFAYPGIYSATDIRSQWWRMSCSSSLAQTPALMRLPSAGWTLSHRSPLCATPYRPHTSQPNVSCSQIKRELISQLAQLLVPSCQRSQFSSVPHPWSPVNLLWDLVQQPRPQETADLCQQFRHFKLLLTQQIEWRCCNDDIYFTRSQNTPFQN